MYEAVAMGSSQTLRLWDRLITCLITEKSSGIFRMRSDLQYIHKNKLSCGVVETQTILLQS